jgi:hypothetical protein
MRPENTDILEQTITLAELFEALAGSRLTAQEEDGFYVVSRRELRRYARKNSPEKALLLLDPYLARRVMVAG